MLWPLHEQHGHIEIVELLLNAKNINANAAAKDGTTPLSITSDKGNDHKDVHKLLLSHLQDISEQNYLELLKEEQDNKTQKSKKKKKKKKKKKNKKASDSDMVQIIQTQLSSTAIMDNNNNNNNNNNDKEIEPTIPQDTDSKQSQKQNNIHKINQLEQQIPPAPNTKPQIYTSPEKLASWSVEEVIKWIESLPLSEEQNIAWKPLIIKYFTEIEFDGEEFDSLTLKTLKREFKRAGLDDPQLAAKIFLEFRDASKEIKNDDPISFYEKTDRLGHGRFGYVFKALQHSTSKFIAIKRVERLRFDAEGGKKEIDVLLHVRNTEDVWFDLFPATYIYFL